jgi:hypothetical protein
MSLKANVNLKGRNFSKEFRLKVLAESGEFLMMSKTAGGSIPQSDICCPRNSNNSAGCSKKNLKEIFTMNSISPFDMMFSACSEDKATLESDLSAVAGGRPIGRGFFLAAAFLFFKYRDTPQAVNSCHSSTRMPEKLRTFLSYQA